MKRRVKIGLERLPELADKLPIGKNPALLCNEASCTSDYIHATDFLYSCGIKPSALFGPQHGISITDQANMIEWEGRRDSGGIPIHSLYGATRKPTRDSLIGVSSLIVDLQEVGSRYYTYIWTSYLCLESCAEAGIPLIVLDRPNPLAGIKTEGPGIAQGYESFVGLSSIPIRHGCTIGELLRVFAKRNNISEYLKVVPMEGWNRRMLWPQTQRPWFPPSPNMPDFETALLYPGACLLEATNISEGRGTAYPFKVFGSPWICSKRMIAALEKYKIKGASFRPVSYKPMFDKYLGEVCRGVQVHIDSSMTLEPVLLYYIIIYEISILWPDEFRWTEPPYEYEYIKPPIDILTGDNKFRDCVDNKGNLRELVSAWDKYYTMYNDEINNIMLY